MRKDLDHIIKYNGSKYAEITFFTPPKQECINLGADGERSNNISFKCQPVPSHQPLFSVTLKTNEADCISTNRPANSGICCMNHSYQNKICH